MNLFEPTDNPRYTGLVVFNDHKTRNNWIYETRPDGWSFHRSGAFFKHPLGATVLTVISDDIYNIAGVEVQKVLLMDEIDKRTVEYLTTRVRSGLTGMDTSIERNSL